jgi:hypothetical protein
VQVYPEPGITNDGCIYGVMMGLEEGNVNVNQCSSGLAPRTSGGGLARNAGTLMGSPVPLDTDFDLSVSFDLTGEYHAVFVAGSFGGGWGESARYLNSLQGAFQFHYDPCDGDHKFHIFLTGEALHGDPIDPEDYNVEIWDIIYGSTGCERNPSYQEPGLNV